MTRMFVRHPIEDYAKWRRVYDGFETERSSMGVKDATVYINVDNELEITVSHDFDSAGAAKAFAGSDKLREAMGEAGVAGPPEIWFVEQA